LLKKLAKDLQLRLAGQKQAKKFKNTELKAKCILKNLFEVHEGSMQTHPMETVGNKKVYINISHCG
jgi:hypothetical protein